MFCVLIVDRDLGFLWLLGEELGKHGIATVPSRSVEEARTLLAGIEPEVDLVVMNCSCPGVCDLALELRRQDAALPVVALSDEEMDCHECSGAIIASMPYPVEASVGAINRLVGMVVPLLMRRAKN